MSQYPTRTFEKNKLKRRKSKSSESTSPILVTHDTDQYSSKTHHTSSASSNSALNKVFFPKRNKTKHPCAGCGISTGRPSDKKSGSTDEDIVGNYNAVIFIPHTVPVLCASLPQ